MTLIDAFTFFNELDILEIRLAELYPVVDWFVLVEATVTHKGDPKPLYYAEARQRFAAYNKKIVAIAVADLPGGSSQAAIWRREIGQRQAIERGLDALDLADDALVLISDLDEIPRREAIAHLRSVGLSDGAILTFEQTLYYFNFNTAERRPEFRWRGTRATHRSNVRALTADGVRYESLKTRSNEYPTPLVFPNSGWHLSYFGDAQHVIAKKRAFLHQELVNDEQLDPAINEQRILEGKDIWGRTEQQQFTLGAATDLPWAVRSDPVRWLSYFHPDWRPLFHEEWYSAEQAAYVATLAQQAPEGACIEIGCWEGRSAIAIAQSIQPRELVCVDHWRGNADEGHEQSVRLAQERDVEITFWNNVELLTPENVEAYQMDWREWVEEWKDPIAFLHLDASHDYESVRNCLQAILPFCVPGAILCGDDLYHDGVFRAVHEVLGESVIDVGGRLWVWQKGVS